MTTAADRSSAPAPDVTRIGSRAELAAALTALRNHTGLSVRDVVDRSGGLHGTIGGWFAGQHVPTRASTPMFDAVLAACGVTDPVDVDAWHDAVARARRTATPKTAAERPPSPYRGLEAFDTDDATRFFGRTELTASLLNRVDAAAQGRGPRVLLVVGASGAGKSSLLRAGLMRAIGDPAGPLGSWRAAVMTPGADPFEALTQSGGHTDPTVLVVDQFEELWTHVPDASVRERFLAEITDPVPDRVVVLALRADYFASAAAEPALLSVLDAGPVVVGPMTADQVRQVIVEPARTRGVTVDDDLVRLLLDEVAGSPTGSLPLLSHALLAAWSRLAGTRLTVADYYATGGITGAVQQSAEEVFARLSPPRQAIAKRIFLRLVTVYGDPATVDGDTVTRRRAHRLELFTGDDTEDVTEVIDAFAARRLLTLGDETVEVSHEALLRAWDRLRGWVDADRDALDVQRRLTQATALWRDTARDPDALLTGGRLALAQEWAADDGRVLSETEREFLDESSARRDREQQAERERVRTLRRTVRRLTVVSVVAALLAGTAIVAGVIAKSQRDSAEQARNEALSRQVATEAVRMRDKDPALSAQLALAATRIDPTQEARSALLDATATHTATRVAGPAGAMKARVAPDGRWFAAATSDGIVRIRDTATAGTATGPVAELTSSPSGQPLYALAIGGDGRLLVTGGAGHASVWDVADHTRPVRRADLSIPEDMAAKDVALSPDGAMLAMVLSDGSVSRWDLRDPAAAHPLPPLPSTGASHTSVAFSPDGRLLAAGGEAESVQIWDVAASGGPVPLYVAPPVPDSTNTVFAVAFSPDGRVLAGGAAGRAIARWSVTDPARPAPLSPLTGFSSYVNDVAFNADGSLLAGGSSDNTVRIWRTVDDFPVETLPGPAIVTSAQFTPSGGGLVTAGVDGTVRLWPMPGPVLAGAKDSVFTTPVAGNTVLAGAGARDGGLHLWDVTDPAHARALPDLTPRPGDRFSGATALSNARSLAAGGTADGSVYLWDIADRANPRPLGDPLPAVDGIVGVVAFSPDGRTLAVTGQSDTALSLFDVTDPAAPRPLSSAAASNFPQAVVFTPDGTLLAVSTTDNTIELWDVTDPATPHRSTTLTGFASYAQAVTISPDGSILAGGSADRSVRFWDIGDRAHPRPAQTIEELSGAVYSLGFSPDGNRLAISLGSGEVAVWNVDGPDNAVPSALLRAYPNRVFDAQFTGDGTRLVAGGPDKVLRLWSTDTDAAAAQVCATAGSPITEQEWNRYLPGVPYSPPCPVS